MTMALTQMQWRIAVESVWAMAQAVRRSTSRLMKEKALVSPTPGYLSSWKQIELSRHKNSNNYKIVVTQNRQRINEEKL